MLTFPLGVFGMVWAMGAGAALPPGGPVRRVETDEPVVAITFDACATRTQGYTFDRAIYEIIKREGLRATIFVSGKWVDFHPDVMEELVSDGSIEFGDHSYDHPHMADLPRARILEEIDHTEAALARYGRKAIAFRPPYGEWSPQLLQVVGERQLPTVTWDVVSGDPSEGATAQGMLQSVVAETRPGSIVIFHINGRGWNTGQALPSILNGLRKRGFRFVFLSELFAHATQAPEVSANAPASAQSPRKAAFLPPMIVGRPVLHPIVTDNPYAPAPPASPVPAPAPGGNSARPRSADSDATQPPSL
jgi:peptidoglycan/xylan/chitin deacetylase (PgdA/CDA1 family)